VHAKGKNARHKMMSLSALGAGALVFGATRADAGNITCTAGTEVGWDAAGVHPDCSVVFNYGSKNSKTASFIFKTRHSPTKSTHTYSTFKRSLVVNGDDLSFEKTNGNNNRLADLGKGATWSVAPKAGTAPFLAGRSWLSTSAFKEDNNTGDTAFANKYALFRFATGTNSYDYGWVELTLAVTTPTLPYSQTKNGPEVDIEAWAYDPSGAQLKAGYEPAISTPEPGTLDFTGLAALALGAAGLRRWRKTRQAD
jgi:hypothetical protein